MTITTRDAVGFVAGDGIRLAYRLWPGTGAPVVALHGVTATAANFVGVADQVAGRRPLLAFDLRGRGDSDKPPAPYGMVQHANDVAAGMRALGLGRSVVAGHSMGGYVAVALAVAHPDLVAGLVLIDGGLPVALPEGLEPADLLDVMLAPQMARLRQVFPSPDAYLDYWRALPTFADGRWNRYVEEYLRADLAGEPPTMRPKASEHAVRADSVDTLSSDALRTRLVQVDVPVRLLRAAAGFTPDAPALLPEQTVAAEAGAVRQFSERVVPDTTHYTIALGVDGARAVADEIVAMAEECQR